MFTPLVRDSLKRAATSATSTQAIALAWFAIVAATAILVRGEAIRSEVPGGVRVFRDVVYRVVDAKRLRLDVYLPERAPPSGGWPAVVAIHGGGWRGGNKGEYGRSLAPLVKGGLAVVAVDYRLSRPGAPSWPGNLDDVRAAVRWVRRHAGEYAIDADMLAVMGASAGGQLALMVGLEPDPSTPVRAIVEFYAPTDLRALRTSRVATDRSVSLLLGGAPERFGDRYDAASPMFHVAPSAPPILIFHGDDDAVVPLEQSRALDSALDEKGVQHRLVVLEGQRHGFGLVAGGRDLSKEIDEFLSGIWDRTRKKSSTEEKDQDR